ncbi:uncharacterized protein LOC116258747 [Nymphaea colorata]|nr:uncharacterized protein LOC116258747 [Nymphaea colorata]
MGVTEPDGHGPRLIPTGHRSPISSTQRVKLAKKKEEQKHGLGFALAFPDLVSPMALSASAALSRDCTAVRPCLSTQISFLSRHSFSTIPSFKSERRRVVLCSSKNEMSFTDRILDYIEGGPKLRKWYGAGDELPKDGSSATEEDECAESEEVRDAILVTDGDSEIGQMVILSLILKRVRIKAIVKDKQSAVDSFGSYCEPIGGDSKDKSWVKKAMKGVRAIISTSSEGFLSEIGSMKGVQHIILLSQLSAYKGSSGIQALMNSNAKKLAEKDEEVVKATGIPYTIIRAGSLRDVPGGEFGFSFQEGSAAQGTLSKEDAATICVEALDVIPQDALIFEVVNGDEKVSDWKERLSSMTGVKETT